MRVDWTTVKFDATDKELAQQLSVSVGTVARQRRSAGIPAVRKPKPISAKAIDVVRDLVRGKTGGIWLGDLLADRSAADQLRPGRGQALVQLIESGEVQVLELENNRNWVKPSLAGTKRRPEVPRVNGRGASVAIFWKGGE